MSIEERIQSILITEHNFANNLKFSWKDHSWAVAQYCPEYFDTEKFDWKYCSGYVAIHCPEHLDTKLYNWEKHSDYVARYCPNKINTKLYNWEQFSAALLYHHPNHKYLKHCIWNTETTGTLKYIIEISNDSIWKKYEEQINDLLDTTKRKILLNKIAKEIKLSKI